MLMVGRASCQLAVSRGADSPVLTLGAPVLREVSVQVTTRRARGLVRAEKKGAVIALIMLFSGWSAT
uniref:Uncharacterized protein n=1 Tax=Pandoraea thiooxydans TaxID=445709 RepID=A0A0U4EZL3_9BURK